MPQSSGAAMIWRWGTGGLGNESPPAGYRGRAPGGCFGGIASRKLIAVIKDIWLPNFGGRAHGSPPWLRHCLKATAISTGYVETLEFN